MKNASRIVVFLVLLALLCTTFISCKDPASPSEANSATSKTEEFKLFSNLPDADYGGAEITVLVEGDYMGLYKSEEICPNEASPSIISDAVSQRNALVEQEFNVKIAEVRTTSAGDMISKIRNNQLSGTDAYDIVMPYIPTAATLSLEGCFYLLNDKENLHLDQPYWDQGSVDGLSINGKNYFASGDFSILTLACTHAIVFNKDLISENGLESPYTLVNDGKWTIDKLREMARTVTADSDGATGMTYKDTYGFLINDNFVTSMFVASGERLTSKDADDLPLITVNSTRGVNVFNKIFDLVNDVQATGHIEKFQPDATAIGKTVWDIATEMVANKRALFRAMAIVDMPELSDYDCNFGILPIPKYDEEQTDYHSLVSTVYASCAAIPATNAEIDQATVILDALTQASTDTVKYNYYQVMLKLRKIKDNESEAMLDLIFDHKVFDLGNVFNWGGATGINSFMNTVAFSGTNTFASTYESVKDAIQADLDKTIETFNKME